jgi:hypothetical protein
MPNFGILVMCFYVMLGNKFWDFIKLMLEITLYLDSCFTLKPFFTPKHFSFQGLFYAIVPFQCQVLISPCAQPLYEKTMSIDVESFFN